MKEAQFRQKLLQALNKHGWFFHPEAKYTAGIPDIVGCLKGRFIAIECKLDYGKPTGLQRHTLHGVHINDGVAMTATYYNKTKNFKLNDDKTYGKVDALVKDILIQASIR